MDYSNQPHNSASPHLEESVSQSLDDTSKRSNERVQRDTVDDISIDDINAIAKGIRERFGNGPPDPDDVAQEAYQRVLEKKSDLQCHNG